MKAIKSVLAAALFGMGSPVAAQDKPAPELDEFVPTGSRIRQKPTSLEGDQLHRFFDNMATCVARRSPARTDYFLRRSDDFGLADDVKDITDFLPLPACLADAAGAGATESMARFSPKALRDWLSEKAYLAANKSFVPLPADSTVPERTYFTREAVLRAQAFGAFSDCIVREDAQAADTLIRTRRGTPAEQSAAQGLVPAMSLCLSADQTLTLTPDTIRGLAAQGLWQRYEAPKPIRYKAGR